MEIHVLKDGRQAGGGEISWNILANKRADTRVINVHNPLSRRNSDKSSFFPKSCRNATLVHLYQCIRNKLTIAKLQFDQISLTSQMSDYIFC
jgi:hypothetical protein